MNDTELALRANTTLNSNIDTANKYFNKKFVVPTLTFNQRGNVAGTAHLQKNHIKLNPILFADNVDLFLSSVIPHEVAHIVSYQLYGRVKPHGYQWRFIMQEVFGVPPEVRHQMDVSKTRGAVFNYWCECGTVELSLRRHNNVVRNKQQYLCRNCQRVLTQKADHSNV